MPHLQRHNHVYPTSREDGAIARGRREFDERARARFLTGRAPGAAGDRKPCWIGAAAVAATAATTAIATTAIATTAIATTATTAAAWSWLGVGCGTGEVEKAGGGDGGEEDRVLLFAQGQGLHGVAHEVDGQRLG